MWQSKYVQISPPIMDLKLDFSKKLYVIGLLKNNYQIAQISLRLPCQQVVELSENIMHLPESTPDISIEIKGCIVRVHGDISEALLEKTVRVLSHVK